MGGNTPNSGDDKYDVDDLISRLREARNQKNVKNVCLKTSEISFVCQRAREVFMEQPILLELNPPVNIVGGCRLERGPSFGIVVGM